MRKVSPIRRADGQPYNPADGIVIQRGSIRFEKVLIHIEWINENGIDNRNLRKKHARTPYKTVTWYDPRRYPIAVIRDSLVFWIYLKVSTQKGNVTGLFSNENVKEILDRGIRKVIEPAETNGLVIRRRNERNSGKLKEIQQKVIRLVACNLLGKRSEKFGALNNVEQTMSENITFYGAK